MGDFEVAVEARRTMTIAGGEDPGSIVKPPTPDELEAARKLDPANSEDRALAHQLGSRIAATQVTVLEGVVGERMLNPHREKNPGQPATLTVGEALVFCGEGMSRQVSTLTVMAEGFGATGDEVGEKVREAIKMQSLKEREQHPEEFAQAEKSPVGLEKK